ncbi:hypothetical protein C2S51_035753 [Perilla frutescens var. frutescens]|nr:hypothetical protein C2S51_035753 [Perilla frutescens var. frutescens]
MGKRLNGLLGRRSKAWKLRKVANVAVSRIGILRKVHGVRCSQACSDVIQLLHQGHQQRALLRVEQVMEEQNALDALVMIESYCHLLGERAEMITNTICSWGECPDELKEAMSSLIFASSRCGAFPELQHIRRILASRYGKDLAFSANSNSTLHPKLVQRLSIERPSSEARHDLLKQIAKDNGIALHHLDDIDDEPISKTQMRHSQEVDSLILDDDNEEITENIVGCDSNKIDVQVDDGTRRSKYYLRRSHLHINALDSHTMQLLNHLTCGSN